MGHSLQALGGCGLELTHGLSQSSTRALLLGPAQCCELRGTLRLLVDNLHGSAHSLFELIGLVLYTWKRSYQQLDQDRLNHADHIEYTYPAIFRELLQNPMIKTELISPEPS